MKTLYVVITDCGDGSNSVNYTFDGELIKKLETLADNDLLDYDSGLVDGDGFHYDELYVPDECTYESLGIAYPFNADWLLEDLEQEEDE